MKVTGTLLARKPVPVAVSVCGSVRGPVGVNDHEAVAVKDVVEVTVFVPSYAVNVWGDDGEFVTEIVQLKLPVASVEQEAALNVTVPTFVAAKVIDWLAWKPVPVAVSVAGSVVLLQVNDQLGVAVNEVVDVTPSAVNVSAVFGDLVTWMLQLRVPTPFVLHAPKVNTTAEGSVAAIEGCASFAAKP